MSFKELTDQLRNSLERCARNSEDAAAFFRSTLKHLPDNPANAPTALAADILGRCDFAVLHKDKLDEAIGVVRVACQAEHQTNDESERLEALLAYLKSQRRKLPT